jgi:hypothetical protein
VIGDDEAEDRVAEELEPLVRERAFGLGAPRTVRKGPKEQVGIVEGTRQSGGKLFNGEARPVRTGGVRWLDS